MNARSTSRRTFVKTLALGSASSVFLGKPWRAAGLAEGSPLQTQNVGTIKVRLSDYPALQRSYGSVRLSLNPMVTDPQPYPDGPFYPIIINRGESNDFYVLNSRCSYDGCVVDAFNLVSAGSLCRCHGSLYSFTGAVVNGLAPGPLGELNFEWDQADTLTLRIPGLRYDVAASVANTARGGRVRLRFSTFYNSQYEVHFRPTLGDAWSLAPFSTSPNGEAELTVINGNGNPITLYADRAGANGFYGVAIRLLEV